MSKLMPECKTNPLVIATSRCGFNCKYCPRKGIAQQKIMHILTSVKPTPEAELLVFKALFFRCLNFIGCGKWLENSVRKFIYKETCVEGCNRKYNKYLCSAKVISFTA
jgi:hypothetical protein